MSATRSSRELIWIAAIVLLLLVVLFSVVLLRGADPTDQIAFKAKRLELVNDMRLSLAAASESQNGAVMATSEQQSILFASLARTATASLDRGRAELERLLGEHGDSNELGLMSRVSESLLKFQEIDKRLLDLAVQNSNLKAYNLAFGPAMKLLQEMDEPLSSLAAAHVISTSEVGMRVLRLASEVRIGALRMQVLVLPHIAEESDQKMDALEARLAAENRQIRDNLASLGEILPASDEANFDKAKSKYTEFDSLISQILKLSRENTGVRAVAITLNEKRQAMLACQDALVALGRAIQAEPLVTTIPAGR